MSGQTQGGELVDLVYAWNEHEAAMVAGQLRAVGLDAVVMGVGVGVWSELAQGARVRVQVRMADREPALVVVRALAERMAEARRARENRVTPPLVLMDCQRCGYNMEGLPLNSKCPECGDPFEVDHEAVLWARVPFEVVPAPGLGFAERRLVPWVTAAILVGILVMLMGGVAVLLLGWGP